MGVIGAGVGATHMRAVGVNEQAAGGIWMRAGARPAPAAGAGLLRWPVSTTPASASSPRLGRGRQRRPLMCARAGRGPALAPALVADAEPPCCINEPFVAPLYLQTAQLL